MEWREIGSVEGSELLHHHSPSPTAKEVEEEEEKVEYSNRPRKLNRCRENNQHKDMSCRASSAKGGGKEWTSDCLHPHHQGGIGCWSVGRSLWGRVGHRVSQRVNEWVREKQQKLGRGKSIIHQVGFSDSSFAPRPCQPELNHKMLLCISAAAAAAAVLWFCSLSSACLLPILLYALLCTDTHSCSSFCRTEGTILYETRIPQSILQEGVLFTTGAGSCK